MHGKVSNSTLMVWRYRPAATTCSGTCKQGSTWSPRVPRRVALSVAEKLFRVTIRVPLYYVKHT